jgi:hypothetical protein
MKDRGKIVYDTKPGKLIPGEFWQLDLPSADPVEYPGIVYAVISDFTFNPIKKCPLDGAHETDLETEEIVLDLFGGQNLGDFVPAFGLAVISKAFAERLATSRLTGFKTATTVRVACNQSKLKSPRLLELTIPRMAGRSNRLKILNADNTCPHCRREPMICPGCGHLNTPRCLKCGKITMYQPEAPEYSDSQGFEVQITPEQWILEGKGWDGSDWVLGNGGIFVSNRAKEWMERTHTFPVAFKPALLNIEGVEDKFKK